MVPLVMGMIAAAVVLLFAVRAPGPAQSAPSTSSGPSIAAPTAIPTAAMTPLAHPQSLEPAAMPRGIPATLDYRVLALAAAEAIYTWDTRTSTYSDVYTALRTWWEVLPDGSNPLTVFAQEFEATGINAVSFATLSGAQAYRTAVVARSACDGQLAEVRQHPAPWVGLHVCTATLNVTEHQAGGTNSYTLPVSIMVNCPPAPTAPEGRCAMVGFYATPDRIVY